MNVQVRFQVVDNASGAVNEITGSLQRFEAVVGEASAKTGRMNDSLDAAGKGSSRFSELVSGGFAALTTPVNQGLELLQKFSAAAQKVWDVLGEGDAINQANKRFDALAGSIGSTGDRLGELLQDATQGAMTQAQIADSMGRLIEMGIVKTQDQAVQLADMITRLRRPTESMTEAFSNFGLMLANTSIMRLDTFGLSSTAVRQRIEELQDATVGLSREQAFLTAVMEEAQVTMARSGRATGDVTTAYDQLGARVADLKERFYAALAEGVEPLIDSLATFMETNGPEFISLVVQTGQAVTVLASSLVSVAEWLDKYGWFISRAATWSGAWNTTATEMYYTLKSTKEELEVVAEAGRRYEAAIEAQTRKTQANNDQLREQHERWRSLGDLWTNIEPTYERTVDFAGRHDEAMRAATVGLELYTSAVGDFNTRADGYVSHIASISSHWEDVDRAQEAAAGRMSGDLLTALDSGGKGARGLDEAILGSLKRMDAAPGTILAFVSALSTQFDPAVVESALKSAYLQSSIDLMIERFQGGKLAAEDIKPALDTFVENANNMNLVPASVVLAGFNQQLNEVARPRVISFSISVPSMPAIPDSEIPALPSPDTLPSPSRPGESIPSAPGAFAMGGWTGDFGGVVHPHELVIPRSVLSGGASTILQFANQNVPGGIALAERGVVINVDARGSVTPPAVIERAVGSAVSRALRQAGMSGESRRRGGL